MAKGTGRFPSWPSPRSTSTPSPSVPTPAQPTPTAPARTSPSRMCPWWSVRKRSTRPRRPPPISATCRGSSTSPTPSTPSNPSRSQSQCARARAATAHSTTSTTPSATPPKSYRATALCRPCRSQCWPKQSHCLTKSLLLSRSPSPGSRSS